MSRLFPEKEQQITPRRLELSLNEDGSLQTAPLLSVLTAATDGLYSDLYNMAQGELEITSAIRPEDEHEDAPQEPQPQPQPSHQQKPLHPPSRAICPTYPLLNGVMK